VRPDCLAQAPELEGGYSRADPRHSDDSTSMSLVVVVLGARERNGDAGAEQWEFLRSEAALLEERLFGRLGWHWQQPDLDGRDGERSLPWRVHRQACCDGDTPMGLADGRVRSREGVG